MLFLHIIQFTLDVYYKTSSYLSSPICQPILAKPNIKLHPFGFVHGVFSHNHALTYTRTHSMSFVVVEALQKRFGDHLAVDDCSFSVSQGQFFSLLGPSGCGKTTLLRMIGGFEQPTAGRILLDGQDVTHLPAQKRPTAMVFQSYALFPSMTVRENVAFGLRVKKFSRSEVRTRTDEALRKVGLSSFAEKPVPTLSGGQQQRVALARAMVMEPEVLLFDEPLSNLDASLREQARFEIRQLQKSVGTTSLYVTHDQNEALALSDQLVVLNQGCIQQMGTPESVYFRPKNAFVATFIGNSNLVQDPVLLTEWGITPDPNFIISIKPENWIIKENHTISFPIKIVSRYFSGTFSEWRVEINGTSLRIALPPEVVLTASSAIFPTRWHPIQHPLS